MLMAGGILLCPGFGPGTPLRLSKPAGAAVDPSASPLGAGVAFDSEAFSAAESSTGLVSVRNELPDVALARAALRC